MVTTIYLLKELFRPELKQQSKDDLKEFLLDNTVTLFMLVAIPALMFFLRFLCTRGIAL